MCRILSWADDKTPHDPATSPINVLLLSLNKDGQIHNLLSINATLSAQNADLKKKLSILNNDVEEQKTITSLNLTLKSLQKIIDELKDQNKILDEENKVLKVWLEKMEVEFAAFKTEAARCEVEFAEFKTEAARREVELVEFKTEAARRETDIAHRQFMTILEKLLVVEVLGTKDACLDQDPRPIYTLDNVYAIGNDMLIKKLNALITKDEKKCLFGVKNKVLSTLMILVSLSLGTLQGVGSGNPCAD